MKRFYVFLMMALMASLCLPQTTKAATDIYMHGAYGGDSGTWNELGNKFTSQGNNAYTLDFVSTQDGEYRCRFIGVTDNSRWENEMCPYNNKSELTSSSYEISNDCYATGDRADYYFVVNMKKDKTYTFTFTYNKQGDASKHTISVVEKGNGGSGGGGSTTNTNPLNGRQLTEGYYLVGNFFAYDGSTINYDAPVFKFHQSSDEAGKAQFSLELPATLDAHAQIMSVDAYGKVRGIYCPIDVVTINNTHPTAEMSVANIALKASVDESGNVKIEENNNYFNFETRRTIESLKIDSEADRTAGQDGSYLISFTQDSEGVPSTCTIAHKDLKRVSFLMCADKDATALAISSLRKSGKATFNEGRYYGSLYMQNNKQYYFISNEVACNQRITDHHTDQYLSTYAGLKIIKNDIDEPTYNKLFLWGCDNKPYEENAHRIEANEGTFMSTAEGFFTLEFNFNKGDNDRSESHGAMTAELQQSSARATINSVSMVGSAIPGTMNEAGTEWDWASTAADMAWSNNENCYKLSLVTTSNEGEDYFRFVANHKFDLNWHEESTEASDIARKKYQDTSLAGHAATASDPNIVCYSDSETRHDADDYHIIWNRPAGNWTVRFYTNTAIENGQPVYTYYYTITENNTLELRDLGAVTYKGTTRNVLLRGDYKYFRTWSGKKNWKCAKNVDVFIVKSVGTADAPKYQLSKVAQTATDYTVIPANAGVVLAVKEADEEALSSVGQVIAAPSPTSYNLIRIPMEEATENTDLNLEGNVLKTCITAQNIPTYTRGEAGNVTFNYLFGFYKAKVADPENKAYTGSYNDNDFLMGFWISNGNGSFFSNSAYLPVDEATAQKMNLGVSHNDYTAAGAKKMPAVLFDFADIDDNNTTGIINHVGEYQKAVNAAYYTLGGQRISKPTVGGIYIHNGKKYVVK